MVALSDSVMKIRLKRTPAEKSRWRQILLPKNLVISETCILDKKVTMEHYQEVMVALSDSVMNIREKRPLA